MARQNIDAWHLQREHGPLDAIIINASGCGTTVKDYGHLFATIRSRNYAAKAKFVSALAKDIAEFAAEQKIEAPRGWSDIRVAYHSACSLQHGQRINEQPRQLLAQRRIYGRRNPGRAHLLRLGGDLQHPAAGDRGRAQAAQARVPSRW